MVSSIFVAIIAFAARAVVGQDEGQELSIDPGSVDLAERRIWCRAQLNSCPEICGGTANPNTCDAVRRLLQDKSKEADGYRIHSSGNAYAPMEIAQTYRTIHRQCHFSSARNVVLNV